jgi:hypothetical protein
MPWIASYGGTSESGRCRVIPLGHNKLLEALVGHKVPFVIVGGHAVNFHGHPRATQDLDVIWLRRPDSEASLLQALNAVNARWVSNEIDSSTGLERLVAVTASYVASTHLMMLFTDYGFLDLFDFVPGFPEEDVEQVLAESVPLRELRYVSLPLLKRMKAVANRPRDVDDLEQLS